MDLKKNLIFALCLVLLFIINLGNLSADLGTYKSGECVDVKGQINSTSGNVTIYYPNSTIAVNNQEMSKIRGEIFNYTFCSTNETGEYVYDYCDSNGENCVENLFTITSGGKELTVAQALMYGIVLFILLILFLACFIWFNSIQWGHYTTAEGTIVQVNTQRTKKIALFFASYIILMLLLFTGKTMAENFMFLDETPIFFDVFFWIMLVSIAPVTISVTAIIILTTIADSKLQEAIFRGLEIRR